MRLCGGYLSEIVGEGWCPKCRKILQAQEIKNEGKTFRVCSKCFSTFKESDICPYCNYATFELKEI